jgi:hypothetical protein
LVPACSIICNSGTRSLSDHFFATMTDLVSALWESRTEHIRKGLGLQLIHFVEARMREILCWISAASRVCRVAKAVRWVSLLEFRAPYCVRQRVGRNPSSINMIIQVTGDFQVWRNCRFGDICPLVQVC